MAKSVNKITTIYKITSYKLKIYFLLHEDMYLCIKNIYIFVMRYSDNV